MITLHFICLMVVFALWTERIEVYKEAEIRPHRFLYLLLSRHARISEMSQKFDEKLLWARIVLSVFLEKWGKWEWKLHRWIGDLYTLKRNKNHE